MVCNSARECHTAIGVELDPVQVQSATLAVGNLSNASIVQGDMAALDLRALSVTHAYTFLSPEGNELLMPVLQRDLNIGARVVTCSFPLLVSQSDLYGPGPCVTSALCMPRDTWLLCTGRVGLLAYGC